jgi:hypothetical protein
VLSSLRAGKQNAQPAIFLIPGKETKDHGTRQFEGGAGLFDHCTRAFRLFRQMGENSFSVLGDRYRGGWVLQRFHHVFAPNN